MTSADHWGDIYANVVVPVIFGPVEIIPMTWGGDTSAVTVARHSGYCGA